MFQQGVSNWILFWHSPYDLQTRLVHSSSPTETAILAPNGHLPPPLVLIIFFIFLPAPLLLFPPGPCIRRSSHVPVLVSDSLLNVNHASLTHLTGLNRSGGQLPCPAQVPPDTDKSSMLFGGVNFRLFSLSKNSFARGVEFSGLLRLPCSFPTSLTHLLPLFMTFSS